MKIKLRITRCLFLYVLVKVTIVIWSLDALPDAAHPGNGDV